VLKLPGVEEAAFGDLAALPLGHSRSDLNPFPFIREGQEIPASQAPLIDVSIVSPQYFHLLDVPLLRGRNFSDQDVESTPHVAIVNEAMARTWWPHEDPIGKRFNLNPAKPSWNTVVGVVANARTESIADPGIPMVYLSVFQRKAKDLAIFLRGQLDPAAIPADVREQVQSVDPQLPVFAAQSLDGVLSASLAGRRFSLELIAAFAVTALLLAGLGVYGVISFVVNERSLEIGIRLALGATRGEILRLVFRQGIGLALAGAAAGLVGALLVSRLMTGVLYGVRPADPLTFIAVTAVLTFVALAACYVPAWRATRVDPLVALRYE
jgi:predicted permease